MPEASLSAEHLLAHAAGLGSDRSALALRRDASLATDARAAFERMTARRMPFGMVEVFYEGKNGIADMRGHAWFKGSNG